MFIQALIWIDKTDEYIPYSDTEKLLIRPCFFFYCSLNDDKSTWLPVWLFFFFFFGWGGGTSNTRTPTLTPIKEIMSLKERKTTSECHQCDCFWPGHRVPCNGAWPQQEAMNSETITVRAQRTQTQWRWKEIIWYGQMKMFHSMETASARMNKEKDQAYKKKSFTPIEKKVSLLDFHFSFCHFKCGFMSAVTFWWFS